MSAEMLRVAAHPGEHVREVLDGLAMTPADLAKAVNVDAGLIERLVAEEIDLPADLALRLARWLGQSPEFWVRLDAHYRAVRALNENRAAIEAVVPRADAA